MINPQNQRITKIVELFEQTNLFTADEITLIEDYLSGTAGKEEIAAGRHRMERNAAPMAKLYTEINEYLYICRQKNAYDKGADYYAGGKGSLQSAE